jgi:hypothetical protein
MLKPGLEADLVGRSGLLGNPHARRFLRDRGVDTGHLGTRTDEVAGFRQFVPVVLVLAL